MKNLYIVIDSELGESDSFEGVFDTPEQAIEAAKKEEMILCQRTVYEVPLNVSLHSLFDCKVVFERNKHE